MSVCAMRTPCDVSVGRVCVTRRGGGGGGGGSGVSMGRNREDSGWKKCE